MQASINYLANRSPLCTRLRDVLEGKNEKIESLTKALEDSSRREETLCTHVKDLEERISGLKAQIWSLEAKEALQCAVEGKAGEDVIQKTCEKRPESECQVTMPSTVPSESRLDATTRPQREQAAKLERKRKLQDTRSLNVDLEPPKRSEPKKSKSLADTATKDIKLYEGHEKEQAKVLESMDFGEHEALLLEKDLELTKLRNSTNVDKKLLEMKNDEIKRLTKQVESATREIERLGDTLRTVKNTSNSRDEAVKILCNLLKPGYGSFLESLEDGGPDFLKALPWPAHMVEALHGVDSQDRHNLSMLISIIGVFHNNLFDFKWQYKRKTADFQKRISDLVLKSQGLEKDLDNTKEAMTTQNKNQKQEINNQKAQNNRQKQEINKQTEEIDSKNVMLKDNEDTVAKQAEALKKEAINMKKLQQTIEELKNELANRPPTTGNNALLDEIVRGHEKELREAKELLAKQAPFVEIGVPVRNRLLEKCKELEHQDAELKELGNIAAHACNAYADALLYEEGFPFNPRVNRAYYKRLYGYNPEYVLEKRSPRLNDLLNWSANMKSIAASYIITYDMTTFNKIFDEIWLMRENDDFNLDAFADTEKGKKLFGTLKAENTNAWTARHEAYLKEKESIKHRRIGGRKKTYGTQR